MYTLIYCCRLRKVRQFDTAAEALAYATAWLAEDPEHNEVECVIDEHEQVVVTSTQACQISFPPQ